MAKKSGVVATTNRIAGTSGKGPLRLGEVKPSGGNGGGGHQRHTNSVVAKSGGTNVQSSIKKIGGESGKGAFTAREVMTGSKSLSCKHPGLDSAMPARMSHAHGLTGHAPKDNNMNQGGGNRIGKDCRTFKHEAYPTAGPKSNYPRHADQPSGHKSKA